MGCKPDHDVSYGSSDSKRSPFDSDPSFKQSVSSNQVEPLAPNLKDLAVSVTEFIHTTHNCYDFSEYLQICDAVT